MSRLHTDLFVEPPSAEFLCSICQDVLDQPLELPCLHAFCYVCIKSMGHNGCKECPLCRRQYQETDLKAPTLAFQNLLNDLRMRCSNDACVNLVRLEEYGNHLASCDFGSVVCPFEHCHKDLFRKDVEQHKALCDYRSVPCPYRCGVTVQHLDLDHHFYTSCVLGERFCHKCGYVYVYRERQHHDCVEKLRHEMQLMVEKHQDCVVTFKNEITTLRKEMQSLKGEHQDCVTTLLKEIGSLKENVQTLKEEHHEITKKMQEEIRFSEEHHLNSVKKLEGENENLKDQVKTLSTQVDCLKTNVLPDGTVVCGCYKKNSTSRRSPESARLNKTFKTTTVGDGEQADIDSILLLCGGFVVVTDTSNKKLKCFNLSGALLHSTVIEGGQCRLGDLGGGRILLLFRRTKTLKQFEVSVKGTKEEDTVIVEKDYYSIKTLNSQTFLGCADGENKIDVLSLSGIILQTIETNDRVYFASLTSDGALVCSMGREVLKMNFGYGSGVLERNCDAAEDPYDIVAQIDGSILVCDNETRSINLLDKDCRFVKKLWTVPDVDDSEYFYYMSQSDTTIACCTERTVYVLELCY